MNARTNMRVFYRPLLWCFMVALVAPMIIPMRTYTADEIAVCEYSVVYSWVFCASAFAYFAGAIDDTDNLDPGGIIAFWLHGWIGIIFSAPFVFLGDGLSFLLGRFTFWHVSATEWGSCARDRQDLFAWTWGVGMQ